MKKIYLMWLLTITIFVYGCGVESDTTTWDDYQDTYQVSTGTLVGEDGFVGSVKPNKQTSLQPKVEWFVVNINYEEGDFIRQWQPIANIDTNYTSIAYEGIDNTLSSMENLYQSTESMFDEKIASARTQMQQAEENINITERQLEQAWSSVDNVDRITKVQQNIVNTQKENAQIQVNMAEDNLENALEQLDQEEQNIYDNAGSALRNSRNLARDFLDFTDEILGVSNQNENKNNHFETYLGAQKRSSKISAENQWRELQNNFEDYKEKIEDAQNTADFEEEKDKKEKALGYGKNFYSELSDFSYLFYDVLDNSVSASSFPQEKIDELKEKTSQYQQNIEDMIITTDWSFNVWLQASLQSINDFEKKKNSRIDELENALEAAEKEYETAKQQVEQQDISKDMDLDEAQTEEDVLERQLEIARSQYEEAEKSLESLKQQKQAELSQIQSEIDQLETERQTQSQKMNDAVIYAPYDGIITNKHVEIWQLVNPQVAMFEFSSMEDLEIEIMVSESKIEQIEEGMHTVAVSDATEESYNWHISNIWPSVDEFSRTMPVEVTLDESPEELRIWMHMDVFVWDTEQQWLIVPYNKVRYDYWNPYVYKKNEENNFTKVDVSKQNCSRGECIVEWEIKEGDIIK